MPTTDTPPNWTPPPRQYEADGTWSAPDEFFSAEQIRRMRELMAEARKVWETNNQLPADLKAELDAMIATELDASIARARAILGVTAP